MFEHLKATLSDLLGGRVAPAERRPIIAEMKRALALAKLGVEDLQHGVDITRRRLEEERTLLTTAARRRALAEGIHDTETAQLAAKYEAQHTERVDVLERKLEVQEAEHGLAAREYDEMLTQLKQASIGVGAGSDARTTPISDRELGLPDEAPLHAELDGLARAAKRHERDAVADAALEALKKRMRGE